MYINTTLLNSNHSKSVASQLTNSESLPFSEVLSSKCIAEALQDMDYRERIYTPDIIIWGFLSQVLSSDKSCQATVMRIIAFLMSQGKATPSANTAAYSKARSRLPEATLSSLAKESAKQMEEQVPSTWLWRGKQIKLIDGSTVFMPDTPDNQAAYPQSRCQKEGLGFPMARIFGVLSYTTGAILDFATASCYGKGTGEPSLLRQLIRAFNPGDVVIGDSCFTSFFLIAQLMELKVDIIFPFHGARKNDFRCGAKLGKKDHLVSWKKPKKPTWMDQKTYDTYPTEITLREVKIQSERKGFKSKSRVIVTTFMDAKDVCKQDLKTVYEYRWYVELDLRSIKDTMHMGILRGKTPSMVHKEIWAHILAYNLIRKIMAQAAYNHDKKPRDLSFNLALQMVNAFRQAGIFTDTKHDTYNRLLKIIVYKTIGNRPGRHEPRRLKRRPKNFPLLMKPRNCYHEKNA